MNVHVEVERSTFLCICFIRGWGTSIRIRVRTCTDIAKKTKRSRVQKWVKLNETKIVVQPKLVSKCRKLKAEYLFNYLIFDPIKKRSLVLRSPSMFIKKIRCIFQNRPLLSRSCIFGWKKMRHHLRRCRNRYRSCRNIVFFVFIFVWSLASCILGFPIPHSAILCALFVHFNDLHDALCLIILWPVTVVCRPIRRILVYTRWNGMLTHCECAWRKMKKAERQA